MKITIDGKNYVGSPVQIVRALATEDYVAETKQGYMNEVRDRLRILIGVNVSVESSTSFLEDLEDKGLISIERSD